MADTDRIVMRFGVESTYGQVASGPYQNVRVTGESLHQETSVVNSAEIRKDRMMSDVARTAASITGDVNFELSYGAMDDWLEYVLQSTGWFAPSAISEPMTIVAGTNQFTIELVPSTGDFSVLNAGDWVSLSGFASGNNGICRVISVEDSDNITVAGNGNGVGEGPIAPAVLTPMQQVQNGVDFKFMSIEREYTDLSGNPSAQWELFTGMGLDGMSLNIAADAMITGSFNFIGQDSSSPGATSGGTPTAAPTNDIYAAVDDVLKIMEGVGSNANYLTLDGTTLTMTLANNLRTKMSIGDVGPFGLGAGQCNISGTFQAYYEDETLIDKHINYTETALAFLLRDPLGNTYVFDFPRINLTSGQRVAGGQNQDVIADFAWTAFLHPLADTMMTIARLPLAP